MSEREFTVGDLPKGHQDRDAIAAEASLARNIGRYDESKLLTEWHQNRSGRQYTEELCGIAHDLEYVRRELSCNTVLDIGTGTSRGIAQIKKSHYGHNLKFLATSLNLSPEFSANLGKEAISLTTAEVLRGFKEESVGMIIAIHSLSYCVRPDLVINRLNEVLVPGGIIKASFKGRDARSPRGIQEHESTEFVDHLRQLWYDVATASYKLGDHEKTQLLLAIKPSLAGNSISAEELLGRDISSVREQLEYFDTVGYN